MTEYETKEEAHEAMMIAWDKMHDNLGGPVDAEDAKDMKRYMDAFREAANDYCAVVWTLKRIGNPEADGEYF